MTLPDDVMRGIATHMQRHLQDAYDCMSDILGCDVEITLVVVHKPVEGEEPVGPGGRCIVLSTGEDVQADLVRGIASINAPTVAVLDRDGTIYRGKQ